MPAPNTRRIATLRLSDRIQEGAQVTEAGCWEWTGAVTQRGYGRMSYRNQVYRVHRLAAHEWLGLDLADPTVKVCHRCDNPPCVNPDHLYLGDQKTNVQDMVQRGRNYPGPARWTHCARGHALIEGNTVGKKNPRCRTCNNEQQRRRRQVRTVTAITTVLEDA